MIYSCLGKAPSVTYSEYVSVASPVQYAMHMQRIILSYVAYMALTHFSALPHKPHDFRIKLFNIGYVFIFFLQTLLPHSQENWARYYRKCTYAFGKAPFILVKLVCYWEYSIEEPQRTNQELERHITEAQQLTQGPRWPIEEPQQRISGDATTAAEMRNQLWTCLQHMLNGFHL